MNKGFKYILSFFALSIIIGIGFISCVSEEDYIRDSSVKLKFSSDTLRFDTVFTTMGSVTKQIMIYNNESKPVLLDKVSLGGGGNSPYRINIDGDTNLIARNIEIGAKDSVFIFARVTIDPTNQNNPLLVRDSIILDFNNKRQYIQLEAFGQDAYYHVGKRILGNTGRKYSLAQDGGESNGCIVNGNNLEWKRDKPHVIFDILAVDSAYTLSLEEGTMIYMNTNSEFWVYTDGSMKINGSLQSPVVFQGMRRDGYYAELPGQWGYIHYIAGSKNNTINYAIIKNGTIGIIADSCVTNNTPTIDIKNTRIENMSVFGLYSRGGHINAVNTVVQNTGNTSVALIMGGKYQFVNCSFANHWWYDMNRKSPTLFLQNYYIDINNNIVLRPITEANFYNTIVWGSLTNEIVIDKTDNADLNFLFESCLIKNNTINTNSLNINNTIFNQDPLFNNPQAGDLRLKNLSPAIRRGNPTYSSFYAPIDIKGVPRPNPPSIGAYEYVEISEKRRVK